MTRKALCFLAVLAVMALASSSVLACDDCGGCGGVGHVAKTVVVRVPVAVLNTAGDVARTTGRGVGRACDGVGGLWTRAGDRVFGRRCR